jgi:hypothetical protein
MSTGTEKVVCTASYTQSFFGHFLVSEFFNTHSPLHSLIPVFAKKGTSLCVRRVVTEGYAPDLTERSDRGARP